MSRIAIVHDYFIQMGGAERVVESLCRLFPDSPVYTTVSVREQLTPGLSKSEMRTSWMQRMPGLVKNNRRYFLLYPFAVESLDLSGHDLIISSSSGYAKGVRKRKQAVHVCYCHTPMRWVWRYREYAARESFGAAARMVLPFLMAGLKKWDLRAADQPDYYIANSQVVASRIKGAYGRDAVVIPPPVDVDRFTVTDESEDYFLVLSRLIPYKRIDLAVRACTRLNRALVVIGDGPDRKKLEEIAGPSVRFLGRQPDSVVEQYASRCRALLFPGEEDFGITPLELNAAGRPVIAYRAGGATETVVDGVTGIFFDNDSVDSLAAAIEEFDRYKWDRRVLRRHAEGFRFEVFSERLLRFLQSVVPSISESIPRAAGTAGPALSAGLV